MDWHCHIFWGSNTINSIEFTISDKKLGEIKTSLIKQAINNAKNKADIAASALGLKVLGLSSINVNDLGQSPPPQPLLQKQSLASAAVPTGANVT